MVKCSGHLLPGEGPWVDPGQAGEFLCCLCNAMSWTKQPVKGSPSEMDQWFIFVNNPSDVTKMNLTDQFVSSHSVCPSLLGTQY